MKYLVCLTKEVYAHIAVEADSESEAFDTVTLGEIDWHDGDCSVHVLELLENDDA